MSERRGRSRKQTSESKPVRQVNYRNLRNPFTPQKAFSDDEIENMHQTSLRVLEELGMKVLLPEAREIFAKAGAIVDEETEMVRVGADIIEDAVGKAPSSIQMYGGKPEENHVMELGALTFMAGAGCPHAADRERGRRPGTGDDFRELMILEDSFDVISMLGPAVEPQDLPIHVRHYETMRTQVQVSDKIPFIFSRGTEQVEDNFQILALARGVSREEFEDKCWTKTIINTNSPRQLDIPMGQGIIDFARAKQLCVITPFCLSGAMAPITVAGGLMLQHAEALFGIALSQLTREGAPVLYGSFASNVDMKSGAPAFGTPEHAKSTLGAGQLARRIGLPWRSGGGSAGNCNDAQAAHETEMAAWSSVLAGCTMIVHSAGWLEGGLTFSYEKMITDMEMVQQFAEMCDRPSGDDAALAFDAISQIEPGGHFFAAQHTMERYRTEFYEPLVADWSNYGSWVEAGSKTADERATAIWKNKLETHQPPKHDEGVLEAIDAFVAKRVEEGGAHPLA
ncbi:MAG: trimethylamine methyltransferase family protein [Pseudomonadota bacterium]